MNILVGNQDGFQKCWGRRRRKGGEEKKHQLDTKSVEQNKRRLQEMTSHSPSFPLLPQLVPETVSGCRNTMGSAHVHRLTGAVVGVRGGGGVLKQT